MYSDVGARGRVGRHGLAVLSLIAAGCATSSGHTGSGISSGAASGGATSSQPEASTPSPPPDLNVDVGGATSGNAIPDPGSQVVLQNVDANVVDQFHAATLVAAENKLALASPTADTMFPPDLSRILFQWVGPKSATKFWLHFRFATNQLDIYTDGSHETCTKAGTDLWISPSVVGGKLDGFETAADGLLGVGPGAKCWESATQELVHHFAYAAGQAFSLEVRALDPNDAKSALNSRTYNFTIADKPALGAIYYWSTTQRGTRRGAVDGSAPSDYLTPTTGLTVGQASALTEADSQDRCVACHTLSRSGKKMSVSLVGDVLGVATVTDTRPPPFLYATSKPSAGYGSDPSVSASWATFSPDENKIIVAGQGQLEVRDISTPHQAPLIASIPLHSSADGVDYTASMPDWAPDGKHIVFAATDPALPNNASKTRHLKGSVIAWMNADPSGKQFTDLQLVETTHGKIRDCGPITGSDGAETFANPMFSPDSRWLVFARSDCESEGDRTAEILLAPAQSNSPVDHLLRANTQLGIGTTANLANAMPTWGPVLNADTKIAWVAFSTIRDYGFLIATKSKLMTRGYPVRQIWIAAIDVSKLGTGKDPSFPAFRLPSQDYDEQNHRPFWIRDDLGDFDAHDPVLPK